MFDESRGEMGHAACASPDKKEAKLPAVTGSRAFPRASVGNASHQVVTLLIYRRRVRRTTIVRRCPGIRLIEAFNGKSRSDLRANDFERPIKCRIGKSSSPKLAFRRAKLVQVLLFVIRLLLVLCPWKVEILSPVRASATSRRGHAASQRETTVVNLPLVGWLEIDAHLLPHDACRRVRQGLAKRAGPDQTSRPGLWSSFRQATRMITRRL